MHGADHVVGIMGAACGLMMHTPTHVHHYTDLAKLHNQLHNQSTNAHKDYTMSVSNIKTAPGLTPFTSTAARQMVGLYSTTGPADAVYYSAHDPDHVVKTCGHSADSDSSQLSCTVLVRKAAKRACGAARACGAVRPELYCNCSGAQHRNCNTARVSKSGKGNH